MNAAGGRPARDQLLDLGDRLDRVPDRVRAAVLAAEAVRRLTVCTQSGRVASALGLSAVDVDTASVAYVHPW